MDDQQVETAGIVDNVLRGLALESVRALVINIDVALALRLLRKAANRTA